MTRFFEPERTSRIIHFGLIAAILLLTIGSALSQILPTGPTVTSQSTETATPRSALNVTTAGGTITTMVLNATTQNPHWKAFVGNVTGRLALRDSSNYTIYDWEFTNPSGEIYVSRNNSINWTSILCANSSHISTEEILMNHTSGAVDSISNTFSSSVHDEFWTGLVQFTADECNFTTATWVNNTNQSELFQEIALYDGSSVVYSTLIDSNTAGFDFGVYDFQLIVPEKGLDGPVSTTPYYFYVELV